MLLLLALACTPDTGRDPTDRTADPGPDDTGDTDTGDTDTGDTVPVDGCRATPAAADRDRAVLVSLPYTAAADRSDVWAVLTLSAGGTLSDPGTRVTMGRASSGEVAFTPDGSLAFAVTEDGTLGVYDVTQGVVVHEAYDGGFYANRVVVDPSGEVAWIVDGNWANNGGGLYRVDIDCETGALSGATRVLEAKLPSELLWFDDGALLVGREVAGADPDDDVARLSWGDTPAFVGGADAFGDNDAVVSDAAIVGDWLLISDISEFSGVPTRVARVRLGDGLAVESSVEIEDPMSLVPFPDGSARVLVASGYGDAYFVLDADAGTTTSVSASRVQLPNALVPVTRGPLDGHVLGSEVGGLRQLQLGAGGVTDLGVYSLGDGLDALPGAIGVAP
ncbi:MAG: hypothetical protein Q8P41_27080 [Pseudomonadota bacterium]|nr:hypothetical protein [Pseudomonadota bacterium]